MLSALGRIVPMDKAELLEKASHSDRSQGFHERLNAGAPQFGGCRYTAVNRFYRTQLAIPPGAIL